MRRHGFTLLAATLLLPLFTAAPAAAQDWEGDPVMTSNRVLYERARDWLLAAAEQAPQSLYDWRPTEEVRTFGQILGHVANSSYAFCSAALGEESPQAEDHEERTAKAGLREALADAFAYCDRAYALSDEEAAATVSFFGSDRPAVYPLTFNAVHDFEHYGNIVTYMRSNGMVPPSSAGG